MLVKCEHYIEYIYIIIYILLFLYSYIKVRMFGFDGPFCGLLAKKDRVLFLRERCLREGPDT